MYIPKTTKTQKNPRRKKEMAYFWGWHARSQKKLKHPSHPSLWQAPCKKQNISEAKKRKRKRSTNKVGSIEWRENGYSRGEKRGYRSVESLIEPLRWAWSSTLGIDSHHSISAWVCFCECFYRWAGCWRRRFLPNTIDSLSLLTATAISPIILGWPYLGRATSSWHFYMWASG